MSADYRDRSRIGELILERVSEAIIRLERLERAVAALAADVDELDRRHRPYGDGTRLGRGRRRG